MAGDFCNRSNVDERRQAGTALAERNEALAQSARSRLWDMLTGKASRTIQQLTCRIHLACTSAKNRAMRAIKKCLPAKCARRWIGEAAVQQCLPSQKKQELCA